MNPLTEARKHTIKMHRSSGGQYPGPSSVTPHRAAPSPVKSSSSMSTIARSSKRGQGPAAALARALGEGLQPLQSTQKHDETRTSGTGPRAGAGRVGGEGGNGSGPTAGKTGVEHVNEHEGAKATSLVTLALPWMHPLRIGCAHGEASPTLPRGATLRSTPPAFNTTPLSPRCGCLILSG